MTTTKDIIEAVRAVQASQTGLPGAYTFRVVEEMGLFHVWRSDGCCAFQDLLEDEAHALANLLNLQLPETTDALDRLWPAAVRPWCNQPFGIAEAFAEKHENHRDRGGMSVMLVIDRGTQWLQRVKRENTFWEFDGRVHYEWPPEAPKEGGDDSPTFGSVLVLFDKSIQPAFRGFRCCKTGAVVDGR